MGTAESVRYEVFEDRDSPEDWRVEGIDHASEGECYIAIFVGFGAEARAREYAAWRNEHPELLEALSDLLGWCESLADIGRWCQPRDGDEPRAIADSIAQARAAVARATGGTP